MGFFPVRPEKEAELLARMAALQVREADLEEIFLRGSGAGGQKRNKTSSAVQLTHKPSGLTVRCSKERSQALNRFLARRELCALLETKAGIVSPSDARVVKQKKNRERRAARARAKARAG